MSPRNVKCAKGVLNGQPWVRMDGTLGASGLKIVQVSPTTYAVTVEPQDVQDPSASMEITADSHGPAFHYINDLFVWAHSHADDCPSVVE